MFGVEPGLVKPESLGDYKKWLMKEHKVDVSPRYANYYQSAIRTIRKHFEDSIFWGSLTENLKELGNQYLIETKYPLFASDKVPELTEKPFDSFLLKTYRKNVLNNSSWPSPPDSGWLLPDNWFISIEDLVRTCFTVKYLDGVTFFLEKLDTICSDNDLECKVEFEAKEEGYYAAHAAVSFECHIPDIKWDTKKIKVMIELQVTTQLQEVIQTLLHKYYETHRKLPTEQHEKWQWNYMSDEFATNYLGHILHYVEGMIMGVRTRQTEEKP